MILFLVILFFIIILIGVNSNKKSNQFTLQIDFPNPEKASPKRVLDAIDNLSYVELLHVREALMERNIFFPENGLSEAYDEKVLQGDNFNKEKYYKIFKINTDISRVAPNGEILDDYFFLKQNQKKINGKYLNPQKYLENKTHFLFKKKVVITGQFSSFPFRNEMAMLLWNIGADVDRQIGKYTDFVIVGENPGWKKIELIKLNNIETIDENLFLELFSTYKPKYI